MNGSNFKNSKKTILVLSITAVTALVITAASLSLKRETQAALPESTQQNSINSIIDYTPKPSSSQETREAGAPAEPQRDHYLITVYEGKIGVFKNNDPSPILTSEVQVSLLPKADIDLLRSGITAKSLSEAKSILEDYR